jgi:O-Antigen ligase
MKNNLIWSLILIAIFFLPLNGLLYNRNILGELYCEGSYYFIYIASALFLIFSFLKRKMLLPQSKSFVILVVFILGFVFSGLVNFSEIISNFMKGRTGIEKYGLQFMVLLFVSLTSLMFYNIFSSKNLNQVIIKIRSIIIFSFLIILIYGFFEMLVKMFNFNIAFVPFISKLIHVNLFAYPDRLRSISGEPSYYGMYLAFALPFLLSYFYLGKNNCKYLIIFFCVLCFSYLTYSRTVSIIFMVEVFVFVVLDFLKLKNLKKTSKHILILLLPVMIVFNFIGFSAFTTFYKKKSALYEKKSAELYKHDSYKSSNDCRFGMQIAGFKMGLDNPVFGVGLGQYGFHVSKYIPKFAKKNEEIQSYLEKNTNQWPPAHGLYARLFAEGGIFALILWLFLWGHICFLLLKRYFSYSGVADNLNIIVIITAISGFFLLGFNSDSFRFMGYWIILALSWSLLDNKDGK